MQRVYENLAALEYARVVHNASDYDHSATATRQPLNELPIADPSGTM
jgi:hypothetical protein